MNKRYEKLINDTFGDLATLTSEKMQAFQREILREVFNLRSLVESENPEKQAEGLEKGKALKALLDRQRESISEKLGLTPEEIRVVAELITGYKKTATKKHKNIINLVG